jgi:methylmalonyl-CoA/ethylmalonyl-CoA epimerase
MKSFIGEIHHIGIVVGSIKNSASFYIESMNYIKESDIIHEINQKVFIQFLKLGDYRIELIEPQDNTSPVYSFLKKGGGLNHICYITDDLESSIRFLRKNHRFILTNKTGKSESIKDCSKVAFMAKPNGTIIELIEMRKNEK